LTGQIFISAPDGAAEKTIAFFVRPIRGFNFITNPTPFWTLLRSFRFCLKTRPSTFLKKFLAGIIFSR
jgi:hypothetical protein